MKKKETKVTKAAKAKVTDAPKPKATKAPKPKVTKAVKAVDILDAEIIEFVLDEDKGVSSAEFVRPERDAKVLAARAAVTVDDDEEAEMSTVFRELAMPKLPELSKENRARLLMQSPNRLYFYWSMHTNPFQTLNRALAAQTGSYTLVLKLIDLKRDTEEIQAVEPEGSWWFNVEADGEYRAEIGFYATNRPYVRALFSNTVETPRKSPSPHSAESAEWKVTSDHFAKVLEVAGFSQDAFDVALAGDDIETSDQATYSAFAQFVGKPEIAFNGISSEDIRFALLALASGATLESLRWRISPILFAILQENSANLESGRALSVLKEQFGIEADEVVEEEYGSAVFGSSLVNFPKVLKKKRNLPKYSPVSSFSSGQLSVVSSQ
jgi:hypothetical protein